MQLGSALFGMVFFSLGMAQNIGQAASYTVTPPEPLGPVVEKLKAGDELILAEGSHQTVKLLFKDLHGTANAWITVRGAAGKRVVLEPEKKQRVITVETCSFLRFENLEITGKTSWDAFKFFGVNSDIVVENCYLHDLGGGAINCSGIEKMTRLTVRHCHISSTGGNGEGFYLGHQDGNGKSVYDSIIEYNLVHDTGGDQGDGIELNEGGLGNTIRFNVVFNTNYPCIFVENRKAGRPNLVEGNICWNSNNEAMQINGNAKVINNLVMGGKISYEIGSKGVTLENNQIYQPNEIKPAELLQRGLALIRKNNADSAAAKAAALDGDGFKPELAGRRLADSDGGKGNIAQLAGAIECGGEEVPEEVAAIRKAAIERLLVQMKQRPNLPWNLGIEHLLTPVQIRSADTAKGVEVLVVGSGAKKTVAWDSLEANTLGKLIVFYGNTGGQKLTTDDRMLAALCYAVGRWGYQINVLVAALGKQDGTLVDRYQTRVLRLFKLPLPPPPPPPAAAADPAPSNSPATQPADDPAIAAPK